MANGLQNLQNMMYGQQAAVEGPMQYLSSPPMSTALPPGTATATGGTMSLDQFGPKQVVNDLVTSFTSPSSPYIQQARQRGLEQANQRGLLNSGLAAANAERSAISAAQPLVSEAVGLLNAREQRAMTRDNVQQQAILQDWLSNNQFNREFNGSLALLPIKSTFDMFNTFQQYAAENPQVWTPDAISGTTNFFTRNMLDVLNQYWPGSFNRR